MKKLLLFFTVVFALLGNSQVANATFRIYFTDYYSSNASGGWSDAYIHIQDSSGVWGNWKNSQQMTKVTDHLWYYDFDSKPKTLVFKSVQGDSEVHQSADYTVQDSDCGKVLHPSSAWVEGSNWKQPSIISESPTLRGKFNGGDHWNSGCLAFTPSADGTTLTLELSSVTANDDFKVDLTGTSWYYPFAKNNENLSIPGNLTDLYREASNNLKWGTSATDVILTLDIASQKISAEKKIVDFTLNGATAPKIYGYNLGFDGGTGTNSWKGNASFVSLNTTPPSYQYSFTAGGTEVYLDLMDSNGAYFKPADLTFGGTESTTSFTSISAPSQNDQSTIQGLTKDEQYVLKLTKIEGKVMFSIEQSKPNAPEVTVDATNHLVITHSNSGDCTVEYSIVSNSSEEPAEWKIYDAADKPFIDRTCTIKARVKKTISGISTTSDVTTYDYTLQVPAPVVTVSGTESGTFTVPACPLGSEYITEYRKKGDINFSTYTGPITVTETTTIEFRYRNPSTGAVSASVATQTWRNPADLPDLYWTNASEGWNYRSPKKFQYDPATQTYTATIPVTTANSADAGFRISTGKAESKDDSSNWFENALVASAASTLSNGLERSLISSSSPTAAITTDARGSWTITVTLNDDANGGTITGVKADLFPAIQYSDWTLSSDKIMARNSTKYFYMSALQNDSRLSPEWELLPKGDGKYALEQFMVIPAGDFIIRQVTKDGSGNLSYKDLGTGNSPTDITRSSFTLGTSPTAGTYTADLGTPGSATPYGYLWNVGYTMANVRVKETPAVYGDFVTNDASHYVVYSGKYKDKKPYVYIYRKVNGTTYNHFSNPVEMQELGDGTYYYVLSEAWEPTHIILTTGGWSDQTDDLSWPQENGSAVHQVQAHGYDTPTIYSGDIKKKVITAPTVNLTAEIDLTKPSTLTGAPVKGMPWVGLIGSRMMIPDGDSQSINTTDADKCGDLSNTLQNTADNGATDAADQLKTAYTMAYMQYTEDGKLLRYGNLGSDALLYYRDNVANLSTSPKNLNRNDGFDFDGTIRVPKKNQLMNSTIQPPRNLIQFRVEKDGSAISLGSGKTTFNYVGVEDHNFQNENGTQHKYAVYEIKGVNMLGKYKIISGFGGQVYGRTPHGLSPYNNWGVKNAESAPYSSEVITESKSYMALTGAGPRIGNDDKAWREYNLNTKGDGITNDKEDNTAGKYFELSDKSYVSSLKFYFALEEDDNSKAHTPVDTKAGQDQNNTSYNGRNFSWLFCDKSGSEGMISLDKVGVQNGVIEYAINSGEEGDDLIDSYTVKLFKVESPKTVEYTNEKITNAKKEIWTLSETTEDVESLGTDKGDVLYTHSHTEAGLENGWYVAQLYVKFKEDPGSDAVTEKVYTTDFIRIFGVSGKPDIVAKQVITTDESAKTKEYTFNVTIDSNLREFAEENAESAEELTPELFGVEVIIPCKKDVQTVYAPSGENIETRWSDDNTTFFVTFKAGYFASAATDASRYQLPTITVSNYIPGEKVTFQIDAAYYINGELSKRVSNYATVTIAAPAPAMTGMSAAAYKAGTYNAVKVASDLILADEGEYHTSLSAETIEAFAPTYSLTYYDAKEGAEPLTRDNVASVTDGANTSLAAKVEVTGLPYYGKENGYGIVAAPQTYQFLPSIVYTRKNDPAASAAVEGAVGPVTYDAKDLWSPRGKRYDGSEESSENAIEDLKQGDNPLGESGDSDKDWRVVDHRWFEKYGGVCTNVDDAYIAAKINPANGELAYKFDIDHQYIFQGGMFAKQKHLTGSVDEGVNEKAPSKYFDQLHPLNGKALDPFKTDTHDGQNLVWWNHRQNGSCPPNYIATVTKVAQPENPSETTTILSRLTKFDSEDYNIWAGCPEEVQTPYIERGNKHLLENENGGGQYNLFDPNNAYHGMLDHHKMRGWNGGELPNGNAIDRLFGLTKSGNSYTGSGLGSYVLSESQAIALRNDIEEILVRDTETLDVKLKDGKTKKDLAKLWSDAGRIVLRVPHVNHETWWEPTPWDIFRAWKEYGTEEQKQTYSSMTDEQLFKEVIYLPGAKYNPAEYRFTYDYPFLAETSLIDVNNVAEKKAKTQARSAESPVVNDIASISTGRIPFDGVEDIKTGTPTSIDDLGAEPDPSAVSIRYLGGLQQVVVSSAAELPAVQVVSVSGSVVKSVPAVQGRTEIVIPVDGLSSGAYIVSVGALKSSKFMK